MIYVILQILLYLGSITVSYLCGSVNNAIIICRLLGYDIRNLGSGNPGAMNMVRSVGFWWGALTLLMDALKGALPALLGWFLLGTRFSFEGSRIGACLCGLGVIIGHIFPVYYKFKGGKGVASTLGVCIVLNPWLGLLSFALLLIVIIITKIGFIGSFVGVGIPLIVESVKEFSSGDPVGGAALLVILAAIIFMHRKNIELLVLGTENKINLFARKNKKAGKDDKKDECKAA
ncbi:MAG: glycerol-3-phosphate 1-O-acyltransferase PlsY [Candidatus Neoclostridium sp.]